MASVSGSRLAFFQPTGKATNVVLFDGTTFSGPTVAGAFNIEVFTKAAGSLGAGFDASAFIQGAVQLTNNQVQAGTLGSTEQLLAGNFQIIDSTGSETIQIVGAGSDTVTGSAGDLITGSTVAGSSQLIDISATNGLLPRTTSKRAR